MTALIIPLHLIGHVEAMNAIDQWRDCRPQLPRFPSPSLDHGFESDRSLLSMMSSVSSRSDCLDKSRTFQTR